MNTLLTIGYGNEDFEEFVARLRRYRIRTVVDVRSQPYSRYWECYRRENLESLLGASGFQYVYLGHILGGVPEDQELHTDGRPDYKKIAAQREFADALLGLEQFDRVALMCGCGSPLNCHRGKLLTPELEARGWSVKHVLLDGALAESLEDVRELESGGQGRLF